MFVAHQIPISVSDIGLDTVEQSLVFHDRRG